MKISTNKKELKELNARASGYKVFIEAHKDNDALLSQCLESNGWDDTWWLILELYSQFSEQQKTDLRILGCEYAKINIEKIKHYCSDGDYKLITSYLDYPTESAESAAESARSAARSAAESAESAARSAAESARSAAESAESAARSENNKVLMDLLLKWESNND